MSLTVSKPQENLTGIVDALRTMQQRGDRIPSERDLAQLFDVKRHQIRKALEILREAGDLAPPPQRRAPRALPRISEELVSLTNPLEVIELRVLLEPGLARFASMRASPAEIAQILEKSQTPDPAAYGETDLAFHLAIATASRNSLASELYQVLRQVGVDARLRVPSDGQPKCPKRIAERDAEHNRIAEAIASRDPDAAEQAMRDHLRAVLRQIHARLDAIAA
ncbi:FadR/GntR family transcriptional regulator [Amorphus sp. 3PC139-8]|uniref:FadR/GntR family transcriptional regulator n=1 Tax=Amorphus sp. 3PC139-8 TaxID=2735676 RepID=UPI00345C6FE7